MGTCKESKHILSTTPGGQISDQKSLYAPIIPLSVPGTGAWWGFQLSMSMSMLFFFLVDKSEEGWLYSTP